MQASFVQMRIGVPVSIDLKVAQFDLKRMLAGFYGIPFAA
jgi:hypothetical protein